MGKIYRINVKEKVDDNLRESRAASSTKYLGSVVDCNLRVSLSLAPYSHQYKHIFCK